MVNINNVTIFITYSKDQLNFVHVFIKMHPFLPLIKTWETNQCWFKILITTCPLSLSLYPHWPQLVLQSRVLRNYGRDRPSGLTLYPNSRVLIVHWVTYNIRAGTSQDTLTKVSVVRPNPNVYVFA